MALSGFQLASAFVRVGIQSTMNNDLRNLESNFRARIHAMEEAARRADLDRRLTGRLRDSRGRFIAGGTDAGNSIVRGLMNSLSGMGDSFSLSLKGVAVAGLITISPYIASAISAALMAGVSAAPMAVGIMQALKDPGVAEAASTFGAMMSDTMSRSATYFVPAVKKALGTLSSAWADLAPQIEKAFVASAPYVDNIAHGLATLAKNAMPGILKAVEASGGVFAAIDKGLGRVGDSIGDMFSMMSEHSGEAAVAMEMTFQLIEGTIRATTWVLDVLMDKFREFIDMGTGWSAQMERAFDWVPGLGSMFKSLHEVFKHFQDEMNGKAPEQYAQSLKPLGDEAENAQQRVTKLTERSAILSGTLTAAAQQAGSLKQALDALNGAAIGAEQAEINYQSAIDKVTASMQENGRTLDANTEKGRSNRQVLLELNAAIQAKVDAVYQETLATQGQAAAEAAASGAAAAGRQQLIASAMQLGMSRQAAEEYANKLLKIPGQVSTMFKIYGTDNADEQIQQIKDSLNRVPGSKTINIYVKANIPAGISMGALMRADGGVIESYAVGGVRTERHDAQMARAGAWRVWAEPETGGESYIPHAMSKRAKSIDILRRTNKILGSPLAETATVVAATPANGGAQTHYHFAAGSIVLDASRVQSLQDLISMLSSIQQTARQHGARSVALRGA